MATLSAREERLAQQSALMSDGLSLNKIAERIGVSRATVQKDARIIMQRAARAKAPKKDVINYSDFGGRVSFDAPTTSASSLTVAVLPPTDDENYWRSQDLDTATLDNIQPAELMGRLVRISPDISRARWDFNRMFDPGHQYWVYVPGTETEHVQGKALLDEFMGLLKSYYTSFNVLTIKMASCAFVRGAILSELILDETGSRPVDLAVIDPWAVRFRPMTDPLRGPIHELVQLQAGNWVSLNRPTIKYVPVDPLPGDPYGVSIAGPALFPALFLLGFFHDLRRVVAQQGYPRIDISIDAQKIKAAFDDVETEEELTAQIRKIVASVVEAYSRLQPDDAYVHMDWIEVKRSTGAVDASAIGAASGLITALERQCVRALKTMPLMMGTTDGVSEANANKQWEMYAKGIKAIQHLAESILEQQFQLALGVQGVQADVKFRFAELRAAEELRDEQTLMLKLQNAEKMVQTGFGSQDEGAMHALNHKAFKTEAQVKAEADQAAAAAVALADATANPDNDPDPTDPEVAKQTANTTDRVWRAMAEVIADRFLSREDEDGGYKPTVDPQERLRRDAENALAFAIAERMVSRAVDKVEPAGADAPLDPLPTEVVIDTPDVAGAQGAFDLAVPDYATILDAEKIEEEGSE